MMKHLKLGWHEDLFINQLDGNLRHLPRVERYRPKALQLWFQVRGKQRQRLLCPAGAGVESNLGVHGPSWAHLGWSWMATFVATQFAWHQNQQLWHHPTVKNTSISIISPKKIPKTPGKNRSQRPFWGYLGRLQGGSAQHWTFNSELLPGTWNLAGTSSDGTLWLCQNSYWKWWFIVDLSIENGDFP